MSDSENKGWGCGCLLILIVLCYSVGALRSCLFNKEPEIATVAVTAGKAAIPAKPSPTGKVLENISVQGPKSKSPAIPSQTVVPLSLNDNLSLQELAINHKVGSVLDLLEQLMRSLESGGVSSKNDIRSRLQSISEAAGDGASHLKTSSELSKLQAALARLDEEASQNTRLSAAARLKTQQLLVEKRRELERIEKLSMDSIKKLSDYENACDGWMVDFDTLWKIDGLQQASKQLLAEITAFVKPSSITSEAARLPLKSMANKSMDLFGFFDLECVDGVKVRAQIVGFTGSSIVIRKEDGQKFDLALIRLSDSSIQIVLEWLTANNK